MKKKFSLEISSDLDYKGMVVNVVYFPNNLDLEKIKVDKIIYKQKIIAVLNQDQGIENIEIKIYPSEDEEYWDFSYNEFMEILKQAKELLIQVNKDRR